MKCLLLTWKPGDRYKTIEGTFDSRRAVRAHIERIPSHLIDWRVGYQYRTRDGLMFTAVYDDGEEVTDLPRHRSPKLRTPHTWLDDEYLMPAGTHVGPHPE